MYITDEGTVYKNAIGYAAMALSTFYTGPVKIWLEFHYKDKRRRDWDSAIKLTTDALQGTLIENDYQIQEGHVRKFHGNEDLVIIKVVPYN